MISVIITVIERCFRASRVNRENVRFLLSGDHVQFGWAVGAMVHKHTHTKRGEIEIDR